MLRTIFQSPLNSAELPRDLDADRARRRVRARGAAVQHGSQAAAGHPHAALGGDAGEIEDGRRDVGDEGGVATRVPALTPGPAMTNGTRRPPSAA